MWVVRPQNSDAVDSSGCSALNLALVRRVNTVPSNWSALPEDDMCLCFSSKRATKWPWFVCVMAFDSWRQFHLSSETTAALMPTFPHALLIPLYTRSVIMRQRVVWISKCSTHVVAPGIMEKHAQHRTNRFFSRRAFRVHSVVFLLRLGLPAQASLKSVADPATQSGCRRVCLYYAVYLSVKLTYHERTLSSRSGLSMPSTSRIVCLTWTPHLFQKGCLLQFSLALSRFEEARPEFAYGPFLFGCTSYTFFTNLVGLEISKSAWNSNEKRKPWNHCGRSKASKSRHHGK